MNYVINDLELSDDEHETLHELAEMANLWPDDRFWRVLKKVKRRATPIR